MKQNLTACKFKNQFILTAEDRHFPDWACHKYEEWQLFSSGLPVTNVFDTQHRFQGWCIGYPVVNGVLLPKEIKTDLSSNEAIENFYLQCAGRWTLFLVSENLPRIYVDSYGSLSTVYATNEKTIASTPTLIGEDSDWDKELMAEIGFPYDVHWLPFGLTFKPNVKRIIPNHYLDLKQWKEVRHWPTPSTDLNILNKKSDALKQIAQNIKSTIYAVSEKRQIDLTLTAGRDSRMVLACAKDVIDKCRFSTFHSHTKNPDTIIPELIAKKFQLSHRFIPEVSASKEELSEWLEITGYSIAGSIWKIHKSVQNFDPNRALLPGMAGEVGRTFYWKFNDNINKKITPEIVLQRLSMPQHDLLLKAAADWISELSFLNTFTHLDFLYIEQRLGCWAAPAQYGNQTSALEISPLNSRTTFYNMIRLPFAYRYSQKFATDLIKITWPELLKLPFNRVFGLLPLGKQYTKWVLKNTAFLHKYNYYYKVFGASRR